MGLVLEIIWGAASGPHGSKRATALSTSVLGWLGIDDHALILPRSSREFVVIAHAITSAEPGPQKRKDQQAGS